MCVGSGAGVVGVEGRGSGLVCVGGGAGVVGVEGAGVGVEGVEWVWSGLRGEAGVGVCRDGAGGVGLRGGRGWCV